MVIINEWIYWWEDLFLRETDYFWIGLVLLWGITMLCVVLAEFGLFPWKFYKIKHRCPSCREESFRLGDVWVERDGKVVCRGCNYETDKKTQEILGLKHIVKINFEA